VNDCSYSAWSTLVDQSAAEMQRCSHKEDCCTNKADWFEKRSFGNLVCGAADSIRLWNLAYRLVTFVPERHTRLRKLTLQGQTVHIASQRSKRSFFRNDIYHTITLHEVPSCRSKPTTHADASCASDLCWVQTLKALSRQCRVATQEVLGN
jgi:hypothetical protein